MEWVARARAEAAAAVGALTIARRRIPDAPAHVRAAALAHYPLVGLVCGVVAAGVAATTARVAPALAGAAGVVTLLVLAGDGGPVALATGVLRVASASLLPIGPAIVGLVVAPMLGAWAIVVQCHGGRPADAKEGTPIGRARFREFGWASVVAFAVTLGLAEAVGLVLLVAAALTTLAVRLTSYRRLGGLTADRLVVTRELVETAVFGLLWALAQFQR